MELLFIVVPIFAILTGSLWGVSNFLISRNEKDLDELQDLFFRNHIITLARPEILDDLKERLDLHYEFNSHRQDILKYKLYCFLALISFVIVALILVIFKQDEMIVPALSILEFFIGLYFIIFLLQLIDAHNKLNKIISKIKEIEFSSLKSK